MYKVKFAMHVARDYALVTYGTVVAEGLDIIGGDTYTFIGARTQKAARDFGTKVLTVAANAQGKRGEDPKDMWFEVVKEQ